MLGHENFLSSTDLFKKFKVCVRCGSVCILDTGDGESKGSWVMIVSSICQYTRLKAYKSAFFFVGPIFFLCYAVSNTELIFLS